MEREEGHKWLRNIGSDMVRKIGEKGHSYWKWKGCEDVEFEERRKSVNGNILALKKSAQKVKQKRTKGTEKAPQSTKEYREYVEG